MIKSLPKLKGNMGDLDKSFFKKGGMENLEKRWSDPFTLKVGYVDE